MNRPLQIWSWVIWLAAAGSLTMFARNPLYAIIILSASELVMAADSQKEPESPFAQSRMIWLILLFSTVFNMLTVHLGDTVLLHLPARLPWLGGPITLEAAVFGIGNGLLLVALLSLFRTFNQVVSVGDLVGLVPAALYDLGLVGLIAITYVPVTLRQLQRLREAQAIRGHRARGWRSWPPVIIPLLVGGLERSLQLAETMVSRGYGARRDAGQTPWVRLGLALGLAAGLGGWLLTFWNTWLGLFLLGAGALLIAAIMIRLGRQTRRTVYRVQPWTWPDRLIAIISLLSILVVASPFVDRSTLLYSPFPRLTPLPFDPGLAVALALLGLPALFMRWAESAGQNLTPET